MLIARPALPRFVTALVTSIALGALLIACGSREPRAAQSVLRRGLGGDVSTLDPQKAGDSFSEEVVRDLFEGLTSETADGEVVPALAESWAVTGDGRTYTFELRRAARWSNGDPVTSDEVVAGLRRGVDPAVASPAASLLRPIEHAAEIIAGTMKPDTLGVSASGPQTVVIHLVHPTPYLPMLLARCVAFPVHGPSLRRFGEQFTSPANLVSNGPYRLEAIAPNTKVSLIRNPAYWDASHIAVDRVEHYVIADAAAQLLRYRANELDMTSSVPAARFEWAQHELGPELQVRPQLAVIYLAFNLQGGPLKAGAKLREALALAIDREAFTARVLRAGQVPAYAFVPPGIPGYAAVTYSWQADTREARLERARRLYRESGYSAARPLAIRVLYSEDEALRNTALTAAAAWKEALGVEVDLQQREFKTFLAERGDRTKWDVLVSGWGADFQDPSNFLEVFRGHAAANEPGLADSDFDRLLDLADAEPRASERLALLGSAERRLNDSYAVAPVYYPVLRRLVKPGVQGATLNPMGHNYSRTLRLAATVGLAH